MTASPVAGADGCPAGWIRLERNHEGVVTAGVTDTRGLLERARRLDVLTVDIPIGLPDEGPRICDVDARRLIGPRRSSVFPAPVRAALEATSYGEACARSHAACGRRLSRQAWGILPRIREVDALLRSEPGLAGRVREVHPELCFRVWAGRPLAYPKRTERGRAERLGLVAEVFGDAYDRLRPVLPRAAVADDDLLDAFAALWTAERLARGEACTIPARPPLDRFGLRMEMVA